MTLSPKVTNGGQVIPQPKGAWHLEIPAGAPGTYRLAQLDDYTSLPRSAFPWQPPLTVEWRARASSAHIPGTWGFGLWNDPFSMSLGFGGGVRRLPALPNAAWFFIASPPNFLSLRDGLPVQGALAATFRAAQLPSPLVALAAMSLPLFFWKVSAQWLRRMGRHLIQQDAVSLCLDLTQWHSYQLTWLPQETAFYVDEALVLKTRISPRPPLGQVIWIDNQFAALPPDGRLSYGTLANPEAAWIEVESIQMFQSEM